MWTLLLAISLLRQDAAAHPCIGAPSAPALDHVVLVVSDLDVAGAGFTKQGFRLKPGRLHPNNLLNRHVKFRDGSSIELMTVQGSPGDAMAQRYAGFLAAGEGGVYVALNIRELESAERAAKAAGVRTRRSASGPWQFVGFPDDTPPVPLFFSAGGLPARDTEALVSHDADVRGLAEAWITGGAEVEHLLQQLGARDCGAATSPSGETGRRWGLSRGRLVVVPPAPGAPRVLGVALQRSAPGGGVIQPHARFWVRYEFERQLLRVP